MIQTRCSNVNLDPAAQPRLALSRVAPCARGLKALTIVGTLAVGAAVLTASLPAKAQNRVYRCGNEYTNQLKGRTDCKLVEGGNVTIVQSTRPRPAPVAPAKRSAPAQTQPVSSAKDILQRRREADAKAILEQELQRAEMRQAELEEEYNDGQPDKIGGEARNYQKYLDRVADLEAAMERNQSDMEGIRRELERYN